MRYAIIENNIVTNIAVADEPLADNWFEAHGCNIGDVWDGESFITPGPSEADIEQAWVDLRKRRDGLLAASDWTQIADAPLNDVQRQDAADYRQALRDFPEACEDPLDPVWPEAPSFLG